MIHALVLAATIGVATPAPGPAAPYLFQTHPVGACGVSIDPEFVRYVPPPRRDARNPFLWLIGPSLEDQESARAAPSAIDSANCLRSLQVRNAR